MKSFTIAMIAATASSRWVTQVYCYDPNEYTNFTVVWK